MIGFVGRLRNSTFTNRVHTCPGIIVVIPGLSKRAYTHRRYRVEGDARENEKEEAEDLGGRRERKWMDPTKRADS